MPSSIDSPPEQCRVRGPLCVASDQEPRRDRHRGQRVAAEQQEARPRGERARILVDRQDRGPGAERQVGIDRVAPAVRAGSPRRREARTSHRRTWRCRPRCSAPARRARSEEADGREEQRGPDDRAQHVRRPDRGLDVVLRVDRLRRRRTPALPREASARTPRRSRRRLRPQHGQATRDRHEAGADHARRVLAGDDEHAEHADCELREVPAADRPCRPGRSPGGRPGSSGPVGHLHRREQDPEAGHRDARRRAATSGSIAGTRASSTRSARRAAA